MNMATIAVESMGRGFLCSWGQRMCPCVVYKLGLSLLPGEFHPFRGPAGAGWRHPGHWFVHNVQIFMAMQIMK